MKTTRDNGAKGLASFLPLRQASTLQKVLIALELIVGALVLAVLLSVTPQSGEGASGQAQAIATESNEGEEMLDVPDQVSLSEECAHIWTPISHTIDHPQIDHRIRHKAVYEDQTVLHSVCNECHEVIDGHAQAHIEETGHCGFTTSVPVSEKTLVEKAWSETVVDEEAWTETVTDGYRCSICNTSIDVAA